MSNWPLRCRRIALPQKIEIQIRSKTHNTGWPPSFESDIQIIGVDFCSVPHKRHAPGCCVKPLRLHCDPSQSDFRHSSFHNVGESPYCYTFEGPKTPQEILTTTLEAYHASVGNAFVAGTAVDKSGLETSAAHSSLEWSPYQNVKDSLAVYDSQAATLGDQRSTQFIFYLLEMLRSVCVLLHGNLRPVHMRMEHSNDARKLI